FTRIGATTADSITAINDTKALAVNGTNAAGANVAAVTTNLTFTSSDITTDSVSAAGLVKAKKNGGALITVCYKGTGTNCTGGATDTVTIRVHQLANTVVATASELQVGSFNKPRYVTMNSTTLCSAIPSCVFVARDKLGT